MAVSKLLMELVAVDKATPTLKKAGQEVQGLEKSASKASIGLSSLGTAMAGLGVAYGALRTVDVIYDMGRLGAQSLRTEAAFENLATQAGGSADAMLGAIRKASQGTISELDMMASANRGIMLGLGASAEEWGKLTEVAAFKGRAMGLTTTQALNDIVTGLGRMSPLILDNLGIVIDQEAAYKAWADSMGMVVSEMDESQKKAALLKSVLVEGGDQIAAAGGMALDAAGNIEAMEASVDNLKDSFNRLLALPVSAVAEALYAISEAAQGNREPLREMDDSLRRQAEAQNIAFATGQNWVDVLGELEARSRGLAQQTKGLPNQIYGVTAAIQDQEKAVQRLGDTEKAYGGRAPYGPSARAKQFSEQLPAAVREGMAAVVDAHADAAEDATKYWDNFHSAQEAAYESLKSTIRSALTPTQVTQADLDAGESYVEKWDENARRAAAIAARGFAELQKHPDWATILKIPPEILSGSEAQLQGWASNLKVSIQNLERPDLINIDAAVAAVKEQMQRQKGIELSLDIIAAEVMKDPSAAGMTKADVAQMLGIATGDPIQVPVAFLGADGREISDAGKDVGKSMMEGVTAMVKETKVSVTLANQIIGDATANARSLSDSGRALWLKVRPGILAQMEDDDYAREWARLVTPFVHELLMQNYGGSYGQPQVP